MKMDFERAELSAPHWLGQALQKIKAIFVESQEDRETGSFLQGKGLG